MSLPADEVYRAGLELDLDETWKAELRRRILEIEDGSIELVSGEESQARVRRLLADLRS